MFDPDYINANPMGRQTWCQVDNSHAAQALALWLLTHDIRPADNALIPRIVELVAEQACGGTTPTLDTIRDRVKQIRKARPEWWGDDPREHRWDERLVRLDKLAKHTLKAQHGRGNSALTFEES
ncbi:hypothetical protein [Magnetococcus sp. PR-3]|uniref:hypothetical protein n=1 Tax=Magnetococcus sp. PR-3 TaxID=3120355 RepID=UPI002FCE4DA4